MSPAHPGPDEPADPLCAFVQESGTDDDADGYPPCPADCDDTDPDVHPEAEETPRDGVDSNCDGEDDT